MESTPQTANAYITEHTTDERVDEQINEQRPHKTYIQMKENKHTDKQANMRTNKQTHANG